MFIFNTNSNNNSIFSQDPTTEESVEAIKKGIEDIGAHIMEFLKSLRRKISYDNPLYSLFHRRCPIRCKIDILIFVSMR